MPEPTALNIIGALTAVHCATEANFAEMNAHLATEIETEEEEEEEEALQKAYDDYIETHNAEFSWLPALTYEEFKREIETEE